MTDQETPETAAAKRYNWVRLYTVLPRNPKYRRLSSDSARVAYVHALLAARDEQVRGEWISRDYLEAALGDYAEHVDELIASTLLIEAPDGTVSVRQWSYWQPIDAKAKERQDRHRAQIKEELALLASLRAVTPDRDQRVTNGLSHKSADHRGELGSGGGAVAEAEARPSERLPIVPAPYAGIPAPEPAVASGRVCVRCGEPITRGGVSIVDYGSVHDECNRPDA